MSGLAGSDEFSFVDAFQWLETTIANEIDAEDVELDIEGSPKPEDGKPKRQRKAKRRKRALTGVSRQRRAANARERRRIQGVNMAFVELRKILPVLSQDEVSKIEILRLATKWIAHLTTVLIEDEENNLVHSPRSSNAAGQARNKPNDRTLSAELLEKLEEVKTVKEKEDNFEICFLNDSTPTPTSNWEMTVTSYEMDKPCSLSDDNNFNDPCSNSNIPVNNNTKYPSMNMGPVLQYHQNDNSKGSCFLPGNNYYNTNVYGPMDTSSYGNCL
ncbi:uncharacterized protein [Ptychodera flava]|uniref:uncharacterized protein n=1 Tax=Ptychodera flava TaxID=63121 RepID=UPI00396A9A59